jgi:hypothetical protein
MMLQENPQSRPNIYQVVLEICYMRGTEVPIKDVRHRMPWNSQLTFVRYMLVEQRQNLDGIRNYHLLPRA